MCTPNDNRHVTIRHEGSLVLVTPVSPVAKRIAESVEAEWWAGALVVEPRYLDGFLTWLHDAIEDDAGDPDAALERDSYTHAED